MRNNRQGSGSDTSGSPCGECSGSSYRVPVKPCRGKLFFFFILFNNFLFVFVFFHILDAFSRGIESSTESNNDVSPSFRRRHLHCNNRSSRR